MHIPSIQAAIGTITSHHTRTLARHKHRLCRGPDHKRTRASLVINIRPANHHPHITSTAATSSRRVSQTAPSRHEDAGASRITKPTCHLAAPPSPRERHESRRSLVAAWRSLPEVPSIIGVSDAPSRVRAMRFCSSLCAAWGGRRSGGENSVLRKPTAPEIAAQTRGHRQLDVKMSFKPRPAT